MHCDVLLNQKGRDSQLQKKKSNQRSLNKSGSERQIPSVFYFMCGIYILKERQEHHRGSTWEESGDQFARGGTRTDYKEVL